MIMQELSLMIVDLVYVGSSIVTPANTIMTEMYGVSTQVVSLSLSMYVLGYGIGPLFFSPISEMPRTGRNLPYMTSFFLFLMVTIPAATTNSFPAFIVCRFLQGLMGAPVLATGGASATDLYGFHKVPYAMAAWSAGAFAGPALGPVMAAFAVTNSSWRWPMYELLIAGVFSFIVLSLCLPETSADTILLKRARRLRCLTKNSSLRSESEIKQGEMHILRTMGVYLTTPIRVTLLDPSVAFINVYTALNYSIIVCIDICPPNHTLHLSHTNLITDIRAQNSIPTSNHSHACTSTCTVSPSTQWASSLRRYLSLVPLAQASSWLYNS